MFTTSNDEALKGQVVCQNEHHKKMYTFTRSKYLTKWNTTECITNYWNHLDKLATKLEERNIATSDEEKGMVAVARMWEL